MVAFHDGRFHRCGKLLCHIKVHKESLPFFYIIIFYVSFKLYIGSGTLRGNTTYTVNILGLRNRETTEAFINGQATPVNYLVNINTELFLSQLQGNVYVGGFPAAAQIKVFFTML